MTTSKPGVLHTFYAPLSIQVPLSRRRHQSPQSPQSRHIHQSPQSPRRDIKTWLRQTRFQSKLQAAPGYDNTDLRLKSLFILHSSN